MAAVPPLRCPCDGVHFSTVFTLTAPPQGEVRFAFSSAGQYRRQILRCELCGHFISRHDMDTRVLYAGDYVSSTYGEEGIRRAFERIVSLPPGQSDNVGRVRRILEFASTHWGSRSDQELVPSVLDVGSGLCVFLHAMKRAGWQCTALDPDPRAVKHAEEVVGVRAVCGEFGAAHGLARYDLVSFNKVLEHVMEPISLLVKARDVLAPEGFAYVEVPDGEAAMAGGPEREEFFIEHRHVFSAASTALLSARAGFVLRSLERIREPSGKYTLRAFLTLTGSAGG